jgi:probable addiction module antidote protein
VTSVTSLLISKERLNVGKTGNEGANMNKTVTHDDWLLQQLADADFAAAFLNAASEDDDPATYLTALRKVVEARGGIGSVSEKTQQSRETLYRTLSARGNPTIKTLMAVLTATGLKIQCLPAHADSHP